MIVHKPDDEGPSIDYANALFVNSREAEEFNRILNQYGLVSAVGSTLFTIAAWIRDLPHAHLSINAAIAAKPPSADQDIIEIGIVDQKGIFTRIIGTFRAGEFSSVLAFDASGKVGRCTIRQQQGAEIDVATYIEAVARGSSIVLEKSGREQLVSNNPDEDDWSLLLDVPSYEVVEPGTDLQLRSETDPHERIRGLAKLLFDNDRRSTVAAVGRYSVRSEAREGDSPQVACALFGKRTLFGIDTDCLCIISVDLPVKDAEKPRPIHVHVQAPDRRSLISRNLTSERELVAFCDGFIDGVYLTARTKRLKFS
ncbi:MAG: hypothetical protein H6619_05140 [Deltaproteobacteria bacterium]|nr:hypothetical protein [Deltaproteobacteria bacterium]